MIVILLDAKVVKMKKKAWKKDPAYDWPEEKDSRGKRIKEYVVFKKECIDVKKVEVRYPKGENMYGEPWWICNYKGKTFRSIILSN